MKTPVFVLLAQGFEELEAIAIIDILRRANIETQTVSISQNLTVLGAHQIPITADLLINQIPSDAQPRAVILPGGMEGTQNLSAHQRVLELLSQQDKNQRIVGAICAAPTVLPLAKVGNNTDRTTLYPGLESKMDYLQTSSDPVVKSRHLITGQGPAYAMAFAFALVEELAGASVAQQIKQDMLYA